MLRYLFNVTIERLLSIAKGKRYVYLVGGGVGMIPISANGAASRDDRAPSLPACLCNILTKRAIINRARPFAGNYPTLFLPEPTGFNIGPMVHDAVAKAVNFEIPWAEFCELNGRQNEQ